MAKSVKILGFAVLGAVLVLAGGGQGGGSSYVSLKANFVLNDANEILDDVEPPEGGYPYVDAGKLQSSPWVKFVGGDGHFRMAIARNDTSGRFVKVLLNNLVPAPAYPSGSNCDLYAGVPTLPGLMAWFWFTSGGEFKDQDGDGVMDTGGPTLNLMSLNVGDVKYCALSCRFETFDDQCEYDWGGSPSPQAADNVVKVSVVDENGVKVWVITPYVGMNGTTVVQDCSKRKMWRAIYTKRSGAGYGGYCDAGVWDADFVLKLAVK